MAARVGQWLLAPCSLCGKCMESCGDCLGKCCSCCSEGIKNCCECITKALNSISPLQLICVFLNIVPAVIGFLGVAMKGDACEASSTNKTFIMVNSAAHIINILFCIYMYFCTLKILKKHQAGSLRQFICQDIGMALFLLVDLAWVGYIIYGFTLSGDIEGDCNALYVAGFYYGAIAGVVSLLLIYANLYLSDKMGCLFECLCCCCKMCFASSEYGAFKFILGTPLVLEFTNDAPGNGKQVQGVIPQAQMPIDAQKGNVAIV